MAAAAVANYVGTQVYIRNATHKTNLTSDGKTFNVSPNQQAWEVFSIKDAGGGKVFVHNVHHNVYLRGTPEKDITVTTNQKEWESWTIIPGHIAGTLSLKSHHGTHLRSDAKSVNLDTNHKEWESWLFDTVNPQVNHEYFIRNYGLGKFLSMEAKDVDANVYLSPNQQAWEKWTVKDGGSGKFVITNHAHQRQLSAHPTGIFGSKNVKEWELWTLSSDGQGGHFLTGHHGQQLGGRDQGNCLPTANKQGWEQWRFIRA